MIDNISIASSYQCSIVFSNQEYNVVYNCRNALVACLGIVINGDIDCVILRRILKKLFVI